MPAKEAVNRQRRRTDVAGQAIRSLVLAHRRMLLAQRQTGLASRHCEPRWPWADPPSRRATAFAVRRWSVMECQPPSGGAKAAGRWPRGGVVGAAVAWRKAAWALAGCLTTPCTGARRASFSSLVKCDTPRPVMGGRYASDRI